MPIENPHGINIDMDQFTTNVVSTDHDTSNNGTHDIVVTGDGIFDILMRVGNQHLKAQLDSGRISGEGFAQAYVQQYQTNMAAALQIWLQKPLIEAQTESEIAKRELYRRQIKGFDEDFKQKLLKIMADAWGVAFSVGKDTFKTEIGGSFPAIMQTGTLNEFFNSLVYPELEHYEWKENAHPDADNRNKLTTEKIKIVNVEKYSDV